MTFNKNDFISIEFTGKTSDGEIFDSNIKEDMGKLHKDHNHPVEVKPFVFCLGQGMFLKSIDDFLIGKEEKPREYSLDLEPENAFGLRDSKLIQRMPSRVFKEHDIRPIPGILFNFDGRPGKVLAVSGGRIIVDFNNILAGKSVSYKIKILKKVTDINEKINALNDFFFRKQIKYEINEKKLILEADEKSKPFVDLFKDKFKEMLGLDVEIKEVKDKSEN